MALLIRKTLQAVLSNNTTLQVHVLPEGDEEIREGFRDQGSVLLSSAFARRRVREPLMRTFAQSNEDGAEKQSPPKQVVIADSAFAMIAATDTTASVLSNVLYCILRYPHVYKRLQAEVDQFYPPEADSLDTSPHPKMPYLDAVMYVATRSMQLASTDKSASNEAMRLWPVNPGGSQRAPAKGSGGGTVGP